MPASTARTERESIRFFTVFHQLEITDAKSIAQLADFLKTRFGKLDILVLVSLSKLMDVLLTIYGR